MQKPPKKQRQEGIKGLFGVASALALAPTKVLAKELEGPTKHMKMEYFLCT